MPRLRAGKIKFGLLAAWLLISATGCGRYAYTRVFMHGEVEDEDGNPVPFAVLRLDDYETVSDDRGHYRVLFTAACLRPGAGIQGVQTPSVVVFAPGYARYELGYHLDTIELIGGGSCPADSDKYLKLVLAKPEEPR